jgi:hypothetical protein
MFKIGDIVICINDTSDPDYPPSHKLKTITKGQIYTIKETDCNLVRLRGSPHLYEKKRFKLKCIAKQLEFIF